ncbi:MAG: hypothetical protein EOO48_14740 [Flavobacterium sp.]|nr:MAG: hypothetical protein EOO48_14740 [Flavobacterium sp.]
MKKITTLFLILFSTFIYAQPPLVLDQNGFAPVHFDVPDVQLKTLMDNTKAWSYSVNKKGADFSEETDHSINVTALEENAFFIRNRGEEYAFRIKYAMSINFEKGQCTVFFTVKEIYDGEQLTKSTLSDYFTSDGKLKEDYRDAKPSLEKTANDLLKTLYRKLQRS